VRLRLTLGPVFVQEGKLGVRRWQTYAGRAAFVAALLAALALVWRVDAGNPRLTPVQKLSRTGEQFFYALTGIQLILMLLVAPVATARALCLNRARGALADMLTTDLSDAEIVLGKLAARLMPVAGLLLAATPVVALAGMLGGIDPGALLGAFLVELAVAVLGGALALALSSWWSNVREVLAVIYVLWSAWLTPLLVFYAVIGRRAPWWLEQSHPFFLAAAPYFFPRAIGLSEPLWFLVAVVALSAGLLVVTTLTLRPAFRRYQGGAEAQGLSRRTRKAAWRWPAVSLDANPALWREWHHGRMSRRGRWVWALYLVPSWGFSLWLAGGIVLGHPTNELARLLNGIQFGLGILLLVTSAATGLAEGRARREMELLLASPLSSWSLVTARWLAAFRAAPLLLAGPMLVVGALATQLPVGRGLAIGLALLGLGVVQASLLVSVGVAVSVWVARPVRAIAVALVGYVVLNLGPPLAAIAILRPGVEPPPLALGSPFVSMVYLTGLLEYAVQPVGTALWVEILAWLVVQPALALVLLGAGWSTFDRCLGRMPDSEKGLRPASGRKWSWPAGPSRRIMISLENT